MEHHFNIDIAKDYGIEEAILLHNFHFWITKNVANEKHYHEGLWWFYNSKKAFVELFPYMNETKIFRCIKKLDNEGIITKGNFNANKWDKTNWYALTKKGVEYMRSKGYFYSSLQNDTFDSVKMNNRACQSERCNIIKYNTNTNTDNNIKKENSKKEKNNQDFIDEIYYLYPSKCPMRNISTGKCKKDKDRIEKLLDTYTQEEIKFVVKKEIEDKLNKHPLKNFSTFLNNFPDPNEIKQELQYPKSVEDVLDKDIKPTFPLFMDWIDEAGKNILEVNKKGFPTDTQQFNRMINATIGGARTLAYVTLVLNRDGLGEYEDERGFMWTYFNYIKKHELYKEQT